MAGGRADALPAEVRADYYREMRHCRSLPESDELLRILRAMMFLTCLMEGVPNRIVVEREKLERLFGDALRFLQQIFTSSERYHDQLDLRLAQLPEKIAKGISPEAIAGSINESLRQQFIRSTIPQSAEALARISTDMQNAVAEFAAPSVPWAKLTVVPLQMPACGSGNSIQLYKRGRSCPACNGEAVHHIPPGVSMVAVRPVRFRAHWAFPGRRRLPWPYQKKKAFTTRDLPSRLTFRLPGQTAGSHKRATDGQARDLMCFTSDRLASVLSSFRPWTLD